MLNKYSPLLQELTAIAPRRGKGEQEAALVIIKYLKASNIPYSTQKFTTIIPVIESAQLLADGKEIPCLGASYTDGVFNTGVQILNSFDAKSEVPAITFNPISKGICMQTYQQFPSVAINRDSVVELVMANNVTGQVKVTQESFESMNILVGNTKNPKTIIFAHYDAIVGAGAIDNAGSADVAFHTFTENQDFLHNNLFVFIGSEEESLSRKESGYGFEMFDQKYNVLMDIAQTIIVLDGIGVSSPKLVSTHIDWVIAISRIKQIAHKTLWLQNDQTKALTYYHTELDTLDKLSPKFLEEAKELLIEAIK